MDLNQERSSRITSSANKDVFSRIVSYLFFLVCFCNFSVSYFSRIHLNNNQFVLVLRVLFGVFSLADKNHMAWNFNICITGQFHNFYCYATVAQKELIFDIMLHLSNVVFQILSFPFQDFTMFRVNMQAQ